MTRNSFLQALIFLPAFWLLPNANAQVDLKKIPLQVCEPASLLRKRTFRCAENTNYIEAAENCVERLNQLETELGRELGVIAASKNESQLGQNNIGRQGYNFSAAALAYLEANAQVALNNISPYPRQVILPDDFFADEKHDVLERAESLECYGGTRARIAAVRAEFLRKLEVFKARLTEAQKNEAGLQGHAVGYGSINHAAAKTSANSTTSDSRKAVSSKSGITGIEQDRKKRMETAPEKEK